MYAIYIHTISEPSLSADGPAQFYLHANVAQLEIVAAGLHQKSALSTLRLLKALHFFLVL